MRRAETLGCLLYATYWFRPILSELIGVATESATVNRDRAPSGPVKVVVTNRPQSRANAGIDLRKSFVVTRWSLMSCAAFRQQEQPQSRRHYPISYRPDAGGGRQVGDDFIQDYCTDLFFGKVITKSAFLPMFSFKFASNCLKGNLRQIWANLSQI